MSIYKVFALGAAALAAGAYLVKKSNGEIETLKKVVEKNKDILLKKSRELYEKFDKEFSEKRTNEQRSRDTYTVRAVFEMNTVEVVMTEEKIEAKLKVYPEKVWPSATQEERAAKMIKFISDMKEINSNLQTEKISDEEIVFVHTLADKAYTVEEARELFDEMFCSFEKVCKK